MRIKLICVVLSSTVVLLGCTSKETKLKSALYGNMSENVSTAYGNFLVFEHPEKKSLMVTSTLSDALGQGMIAGLTMGAAITTPSEGAAQQAAEIYMKRHDVFRGCRVINGYLVQTPNYEFLLSCP